MSITKFYFCLSIGLITACSGFAQFKESPGFIPVGMHEPPRTSIGLDMYSLSLRTASVVFEGRMSKMLTLYMQGGYMFETPFNGDDYFTDNTINGGFFKFGPRYRMYSGGYEWFFAGAAVGASYYNQKATLHIPEYYGMIVQRMENRGMTPGFTFSLGHTFYIGRFLATDFGVDYNLVRPRPDFLSNISYNQPGFGFIDKDLYHNRTNGWQQSFTGLWNVRIILNPKQKQ